ncbi:hypothetical protein RP20_CCG013823 [Aedes albopictus]|nr:hypothetical protein RP20_CCG013823 [Aedes albopictus]
MDSLPRVPDTHGDTVDEKVFSDLYIRTSWFDASIALDQIEKISLSALQQQSNAAGRDDKPYCFGLRYTPEKGNEASCNRLQVVGARGVVYRTARQHTAKRVRAKLNGR